MNRRQFLAGASAALATLGLRGVVPGLADDGAVVAEPVTPDVAARPSVVSGGVAGVTMAEQWAVIELPVNRQWGYAPLSFDDAPITTSAATTVVIRHDRVWTR